MMRGALIVAVLLTAGCVEAIKENRVQSALIGNGIAPAMADCMAHQMAKKLTVAQLRRLSELGGEKHGWLDYVAAVRRVNDPEALQVLVSSAALCKAGLIR